VVNRRWVAVSTVFALIGNAVVIVFTPLEAASAPFTRTNLHQFAPTTTIHLMHHKGTDLVPQQTDLTRILHSRSLARATIQP